MAKLNVFSKELNAAEIKAMSDAGIESNIEETHGEQRHIKWEDILLKPRTGNVAEIEVPASTILGNLTNKLRNDPRGDSQPTASAGS